MQPRYRQISAAAAAAVSCKIKMPAPAACACHARPPLSLWIELGKRPGAAVWKPVIVSHLSAVITIITAVARILSSTFDHDQGAAERSEPASLGRGRSCQPASNAARAPQHLGNRAAAAQVGACRQQDQQCGWEPTHSPGLNQPAIALLCHLQRLCGHHAAWPRDAVHPAQPRRRPGARLGARRLATRGGCCCHLYHSGAAAGLDAGLPLPVRTGGRQRPAAAAAARRCVVVVCEGRSVPAAAVAARCLWLGGS